MAARIVKGAGVLDRAVTPMADDMGVRGFVFVKGESG